MTAGSCWLHARQEYRQRRGDPQIGKTYVRLHDLIMVFPLEQIRGPPSPQAKRKKTTVGAMTSQVNYAGAPDLVSSEHPISASPEA